MILFRNIFTFSRRICDKMMLIIQLLFYSVMLFNLRANANDDLNGIKVYVEKILKCFEDNTVTPEELAGFDQTQLPDNENARCVVACIYKSTGLLDDQGMMSAEGVDEIAGTLMTDDPERQEKAEHFKEACLSVNNVEVSDGAKGCERAALLYKCRVDKAPEFLSVT